MPYAEHMRPGTCASTSPVAIRLNDVAIFVLSGLVSSRASYASQAAERACMLDREVGVTVALISAGHLQDALKKKKSFKNAFDNGLSSI